jgi:hypothetical protein
MEILHTILYWSFPVLLFVGITGMVICLSHLKQIESKKYSDWKVNIVIAILCMITGVPGFGILNHFAEIPAGPWNILIVIIVGILTKNVLLRIIQKYWPDYLTTFSLKHFG